MNREEHFFSNFYWLEMATNLNYISLGAGEVMKAEYSKSRATKYADFIHLIGDEKRLEQKKILSKFE